MTATSNSTTVGEISHDEVAERFFDAIGKGDLAAVTEMYSDDIEVWHNYDDVSQTKEQNLRSLSWINAKLGPLQYVEVQRSVLPDGFWQQHVTKITRDGVTTRVPAALRAFCRDGKIVRIEEYLDPAPINALIAARAKK